METPNVFDRPEANIMNLVRGSTNIPVPRIHRLISSEEVDYRHCLFVMDCIKGKLLSRVWNQLSLWKKLWVVIALHRYVRELRRIKQRSDGPVGPISSGGEPMVYELPNMFSRPMTFSSYDALKQHFWKGQRRRLSLRRSQSADAVSWRLAQRQHYTGRRWLALVHCLGVQRVISSVVRI
ncbi:hypothetical protein D9758_017019 [Tetrapyrgos nigripes]|uniref:Uncharacterized protein n=1 Tax=Tetrapyrgos nigripes TaxID=182062 RepID=A0A8H5BS08_9AGAR|nr:hypothetical protein D9758_017019 [Tetrapyrgos nigripes]